MRQHCLPTVVPLPLQCCMPLVCCSTASQHCSAASGLQQQCLWTAVALLLDSDTAFPMRQHCLQLVAAMPAHGSGSAFTMRQHCLPTVVPLPLQCCMPLVCCSTASQHCSAASGLQHLCLWTAAALLLDSDTAFPMRQHCLPLVAAMPAHGSGSAFRMWQHCLQLVAYLHMAAAVPSQCGSTAFSWWHTFAWQRQCLHNEAALPSNSGATASATLHAFGMLQHCIPTLQRCQWTAAAVPVDGSSTVVGQ